VIRKVPEAQLVEALMQEIEHFEKGGSEKGPSS
jgi:hypothetical protein